MKKINCIIMDWAGTAIDFGCFAPVEAFIKAFNEIDINISVEEVRVPMGLAKIEHIRQLLQMGRINKQFHDLYGREWNENDAIELNKCFEKNLFESLANYAIPIPKVIQTLESLKEQGLKIGSTTGYTRDMMDIVQPTALIKGYEVDSCVTPDAFSSGRPAPFMIFQNMMNLDVKDLDCVIKVGDTVEDIKEGVNAKVWSVGVIIGSSMLGLTEQEFDEMPIDDITDRMTSVHQQMLDAGADYVISSIEELPTLVNEINNAFLS